jgi:hypothetical protein
MSKQIRMDDLTYDALTRISQRYQKRNADCLSQIVSIFEQVLDRLDDDGRLLIEGPEQARTEILVPLRMPKARRQPQAAARRAKAV